MPRLKGPFIIDALVDLFDKSIIDNNLVKEALLYGLVSSGNDLQEIRKNRTRNRINVLLAGNPGLGKSCLAKKGRILNTKQQIRKCPAFNSKKLDSNSVKGG